MHPPEIYRWKLAKSRYERAFRRQVPQWVLAFDREEMIAFLNLCIKFNWRLPSKILIEGERHQGPDSLWMDKRTNADWTLEQLKNKHHPPLDLQNLPFDPAQAAGEASLRITEKIDPQKQPAPKKSTATPFRAKKNRT